MKWDHYAKITRPGSSDDGSGTDYDFENNSEPEVVYEKYPCTIIEDVASYDTSEEGESYTGNAVLKGKLTNRLKEGDIVDGRYKIVGPVEHPHNRHTRCSLVRTS